MCQAIWRNNLLHFILLSVVYILKPRRVLFSCKLSAQKGFIPKSFLLPYNEEDELNTAEQDQELDVEVSSVSSSVDSSPTSSRIFASSRPVLYIRRKKINLIFIY